MLPLPSYFYLNTYILHEPSFRVPSSVPSKTTLRESKMAARRFFVMISTTSQHWSQACDSTEVAIDIALQLAKEKNLVNQDLQSPKLIAVEKWVARTHIVFDVLHHAYDSKTAHLPNESRLPVIQVTLSRIDSVQSATEGIEKRINAEVQETHRLHPEGMEPPFIIDHTNGSVPCYKRPRASKEFPYNASVSASGC